MKYIICALLVLSIATSLNELVAQTPIGLQALKNYRQKVFYSPGHKQKAKFVAKLTADATGYIGNLLNFHPKIIVQVLNPEHWKNYAKYPLYGMPHYADKFTLVVAAENNDFWRNTIPPLDNLPPDLTSKIKATYTSSDKKLSMEPFFDLLAIHEVGHLFHEQANVQFPRKWLMELFGNILLHTYIAEKRLNLLPALEIFPAMVVAAGTSQYKYTSLHDFEEYYYPVMDGRNYGWYQSRLHVAAKNIYNAGGKEVLVNLWKALSTAPSKMSDEQLVSFLKTKVHQSVADVMLSW